MLHCGLLRLLPAWNSSGAPVWYGEVSTVVDHLADPFDGCQWSGHRASVSNPLFLASSGPMV